jgi:hypothetical protein
MDLDGANGVANGSYHGLKNSEIWALQDIDATTEGANKYYQWKIDINKQIENGTWKPQALIYPAGSSPTPTVKLETQSSNQAATATKIVEDNTPNKNSNPAYVTLYRGVGPDISPSSLYTFAQQKLAIPKGLLPQYCKVCHSDPNDHTAGDNISIFTSWSKDKKSCRTYGKRADGNKYRRSLDN